MFDTLLVPVDDSPESERIIPLAARLALAVGAGIEFLTIDSPNVDAATTALYQQGLIQALPDGVTGRGTVTLGEAPIAELLLDAYRARPRALLALATRAPGSLWQWLGGGSIGDDVVQETLRPVLLAGPQCDASAAAVTFADHTTAALDGSSLDEQVIAAAVDWCRALGSPLTLLRAVIDPADPTAHRQAYDDVSLRAAEAGRHGVEARARIVDAGDPGKAVLRQVVAAGGIVVVGSHRRGPLGRIVHGSNALWITHRSTVPVLVAGFTTLPVTEPAAPEAAPAVDGPRLAPCMGRTLAELVGWSDLRSIAP